MELLVKLYFLEQRVSGEKCGTLIHLTCVMFVKHLLYAKLVIDTVVGKKTNKHLAFIELTF